MCSLAHVQAHTYTHTHTAQVQIGEEKITTNYLKLKIQQMRTNQLIRFGKANLNYPTRSNLHTEPPKVLAIDTTGAVSGVGQGQAKVGS